MCPQFPLDPPWDESCILTGRGSHAKDHKQLAIELPRAGFKSDFRSPGTVESSLLLHSYEFRLALSPEYCNAYFLALVSEMKFLQKIVI